MMPSEYSDNTAHPVDIVTIFFSTGVLKNENLAARVMPVVELRSLVTMIGEGPMSTPLAVTNARRLVVDVRLLTTGSLFFRVAAPFYGSKHV